MLHPALSVILAAIIWGSAGVFVKIVNLPPVQMAFFRFAVPALVLGIFFAKKRHNIFRRANKALLVASLFNAIRLPLYIFAFLSTSLGNAVIIFYTWPLMASLLSVLYLKEEMTRRKILLLTTGFIGVLIMYANKQFSFARADILGMSAMFVSGTLYAMTLVIFKKQLKKYTKEETVFFQNSIGALLFLPFLFILYPFPTGFQVTVSSIYAFFIGVVGFLLFFSALSKIKASTASMLSYVEVVSAVIFGMLFFGESVTINMLIGGLLIISSSILITRSG